MAGRLFRVLVAALLLGATGLAQAPVPSARDEDFAKAQYDSGLAFLQNKRYTEALKDFQVVIDSFPRSRVADDALLQIALYQIDIAADIPAAQTATDKLLKDYPDTDSTPMAYVLQGRLTMARGHATADVDAALASYERVPRLFPTSDAVPAAIFYSAETMRQVRRTDDAIAQYSRVTMEYPRSVWAARAALQEAKALVQADRPARAIAPLQHVRQQFPGTPEAAAALDYNTILYRLFLRAPAQPAYAFANRTIADTAKLSDVVGLSFDPTGRLFIGHKKGVTIFDGKGALVRAVAGEPDSFFLDERGRVVLARKGVLTPEGGEAVAVDIPPSGPNGKTKVLDQIPAVAMMHNGDRLIADRDDRWIVRFSSEGKYVGVFAQASADGLAVNDLDMVAVINHDPKAIAIFDRDGKVLTTIPGKTTAYELNAASDLVFDPLGYLYVLDRGKPTVFVFSPKGALVTTLSVPEKAAGAFQKPMALTVDTAGRVFIYDDHVQRVQVYQ